MANRALVVIDVQNEYISGELPIAYPELSVSLVNIGVAKDAAVALGMPVVVVQQVAPETSPIFAKGSHGYALHEEPQLRPPR
jgi:nicotinamidase-related amidase